MLGMGTGGHDPLGQKSGRPESEMIGLLHRAFDLGVNLFDTAPGYMESEAILGRALEPLPRQEIVVSTKLGLAPAGEDNELYVAPDDVAANIDRSLQRLGLDYIDVLLITADLKHFPVVMDRHIPELEALKQSGKIRALGSTEWSVSDGAHQWLEQMLPTGVLDVAMVAHNMINQSAQDVVLPHCSEHGIGVVNIFTVRNLFWDPERLREVLDELAEKGLVRGPAAENADPLGWLVADGIAGSLVEAAYRYCAYTSGVTTVMCGTLDVGELEHDVAFLEEGPLPSQAIHRLRETFRHVAEPIGN
jgi:aryl-alcohol dehydrogenase-like predicted oxidoreductase